MAPGMISSPFGRFTARVVKVLALLSLLMWAASVGCLWVSESRLVFRAHVTHGIQGQLGSPFVPAEFASADGIALEAVVLRAVDSGPRSYWILFCPGAGNSIHFDRVQRQLTALQTLGYNVLAFNYRGFGRTRGEPTEAGLYEDALAAYRYLTRELGAAPSQVVLGGRSLGSAVAVELATRVASAGLLLLSPIASVPETAALLYPWAPVRLLASNRFDSATKIARLDRPVVLVHATNDRLVPIEEARRLYGLIRAPKLMLETGGGHNRAGFSPVSELGDALSQFWPIALESPSSGPLLAGSD